VIGLDEGTGRIKKKTKDKKKPEKKPKNKILPVTISVLEILQNLGMVSVSIH